MPEKNLRWGDLKKLRKLQTVCGPCFDAVERGAGYGAVVDLTRGKKRFVLTQARIWQNNGALHIESAAQSELTKEVVEVALHEVRKVYSKRENANKGTLLVSPLCFSDPDWNG